MKHVLQFCYDTIKTVDNRRSIPVRATLITTSQRFLLLHELVIKQGGGGGSCVHFS
jgi:hypothetical protein